MMRGTIGVWTSHKIERKRKVGRGDERWFDKDFKATLWLHLASSNLPDSQLSLESKMEPSAAII